MKKKTAYIAVIILLLLLCTGFLIKSGADKRQQEAIEAGQAATIVSHDKTVLPGFIYNIDSISMDSIVGQKHCSFSYPEQESLKAVAEMSSQLVHGRITNLSFTFMDGQAWTVADLQITASYKGELKKDDVISLYYPGGYVSVSDYNSYHHIKSGGGENEFYQSFPDSSPLPCLMDEGLFFLSDDNSAYSLPEGTYFLSCGNSSICSYADEDTYIWLNNTISLQDILNSIN